MACGGTGSGTGGAFSEAARSVLRGEAGWRLEAGWLGLEVVSEN